ncbi:hypothetical protein ACFOEE_15340 [Pseudoalteromonas fenneropenaei]|uniref:Uncharacterized protein n=1 Tax=Pseudoalteromonas fenneropenaei TaxID=1737459 RepID=A0ABV7CMY9_9GAMM
MKLQLKKKSIKKLVAHTAALPAAKTPQVAGGYTTRPWTYYCEESGRFCEV